MSTTHNSQFIIRNSKNHKWNISLIMIFVLAIGAIMGLMSTNFLQNMIRETSSLKTSYQSYYLAKWWIELGNLAINRYDYWFEDTLHSGSALFTQNLLCGSNCPIDVTISSLINSWRIWKESSPVLNCTSDNAIWIEQWSSQIIPLFIDTRKLAAAGTTKTIISDYQLSLEGANNMNGDIWVWIILSTGNQNIYDQQDINDMQKLYITGNIAWFNITNLLLQNNSNINNSGTTSQTISTLLTNWNPYNYLAITNIGTNNLWFCLHFSQNNQWWYPWDTSKVISTASYKDSSLSLQSIIKKTLPDYIYNSYQGN